MQKKINKVSDIIDTIWKKKVAVISEIWKKVNVLKLSEY